MRPGLWLNLAVLFSGFASLAYQVAWTRALTSVTSATASAQAAVLAVFMAGLGLGSILAGQLAPRLRRPLLVYAGCEFLAAVLAVLGMPLIVFTARIVPWLATLAPGGLDPFWLQLLFVALYLLLPTTLLGMSLPLLIEHLERLHPASGPVRGFWMGLLYGCNTIGAAAGTLVAGFVTIEYLGLVRTAALGGGLALLAGMVAVLVSRSSPAPSPGAPTGDAGRIGSRVVAAAALGGMVGLSVEVIWTRLVSVVVINTVHAFTEVLAAVLIGVAAGGYLAAVMSRQRQAGEPAERMLVGLAGLQGLAAVLMAAVPLLLLLFARSGASFQGVARGDSALQMLQLFALLIPPAALNAAVLPLLSAGVGLLHGSRAFGRLYAANTAGSVVGSLLAGFVLLPWLGMHMALTLVALASLGVALLVLPGMRRHRRLLASLGGAAVLVVLPFGIFDLPRQILETVVPADSRILDLHEGVGSTVMITQDTTGHRRLWVNSSFISTTAGRRSRILGHLPTLLVDRPVHMLGIAMGSGQTFAAALQHHPDSFDAVEIDENVILFARKWFADVTGDFFKDARVRVHHADGRAYLRAMTGMVDLIVLEPSPTWSAGMTTLYTQEFYQDCRRVLAPGGVLAQMMPFYGQTPEDLRAMIGTALGVFPEASLWQDQYESILVLQNEPLSIDPASLRRRARERGVGPELLASNLATASDLLSLFLMGTRALRTWTDGAPVVEDDRPFLEFSAARVVGQDLTPAIAGALTPFLEKAADYSLQAAEEDKVFREATLVRDTLFALSGLKAGRDFSQRVTELEGGLQQAPDSKRLQGFYRPEILAWANTQRTGRPTPQEILVRGIEHLPDFGEAGALLAVQEAEAGRLDSALAIAQRFEPFARTRTMIQQLLQDLGQQRLTPPQAP